MSNIVLLFDGTWNTEENPSERTNVYRLARMLTDGPNQQHWYDRGVGTTRWNERLSGALGYGLDLNIQQGYAYIVETYQPGDKIFLFGFSRGAYTARSLAGMIRKCHLIPRDVLRQYVPAPNFSNKTDMQIEQILNGIAMTPVIQEAYALYRTYERKPDSPKAIQFRAAYNAKPIPIHFIGVWDTVGNLGIPKSAEKMFSSDNREYRFHDTSLSHFVEHAYHAVAIDEHRGDYAPTLWTRPKPKEPGEPVDPNEPEVDAAGRKKALSGKFQTVEQYWFVGAHADVGGGYPSPHPLADVTLQWMAQKARDCTLALAQKPEGSFDPSTLGKARDSYAEFLGWWGWLYRWFVPRTYRTIESKNIKIGWPPTEFAHDSVAKRLVEEPDYPGRERFRFVRNRTLREMLNLPSR